VTILGWGGRLSSSSPRRCPFLARRPFIGNCARRAQSPPASARIVAPPGNPYVRVPALPLRRLLPQPDYQIITGAAARSLNDDANDTRHAAGCDDGPGALRSGADGRIKIHGPEAFEGMRRGGKFSPPRRSTSSLLMSVPGSPPATSTGCATGSSSITMRSLRRSTTAASQNRSAPRSTMSSVTASRATGG